MNTIIYREYLKDAKEDISHFIYEWELRNNKVFPERAMANAWRVAVVLWPHVRSNKIKADPKDTEEVFELKQVEFTNKPVVFESRVKDVHRTLVTSSTPDGRAYSELMAALKSKYAEYIPEAATPKSKISHTKKSYSLTADFIVPSQIRKSHIHTFNMLGMVMEDIVSGLSYDAIQAKRDVTLNFIHKAYALYTERTPVLISFSGNKHTVQK